MCAGLPKVSTATMPLVRGVMASSTCEGSMLSVTGSISTNTGLAPAMRMQFALATNEKGVVMTSSPGPMLSARNAR